jgi:hypothetical protein
LNGSGVFIGLDLSIVRPPKADYPGVVASWGEHDDIDQRFDVADGDVSRFSIVGARVLAGHRSIPIEPLDLENGSPRSRRFHALLAGSNSIAIV